MLEVLDDFFGEKSFQRLKLILPGLLTLGVIALIRPEVFQLSEPVPVLLVALPISIVISGLSSLVSLLFRRWPTVRHGVWWAVTALLIGGTAKWILKHRPQEFRSNSPSTWTAAMIENIERNRLVFVQTSSGERYGGVVKFAATVADRIIGNLDEDIYIAHLERCENTKGQETGCNGAESVFIPKDEIRRVFFLREDAGWKDDYPCEGNSYNDGAGPLSALPPAPPSPQTCKNQPESTGTTGSP